MNMKEWRSRTKVRVWNDGQVVYTGDLNGFLQDNQYNPEVVMETNRLKNHRQIQFGDMHTGEWVIRKEASSNP